MKSLNRHVILGNSNAHTTTAHPVGYEGSSLSDAPSKHTETAMEVVPDETAQPKQVTPYLLVPSDIIHSGSQQPIVVAAQA